MIRRTVLCSLLLCSLLLWASAAVAAAPEGQTADIADIAIVMAVNGRFNMDVTFAHADRTAPFCVDRLDVVDPDSDEIVARRAVRPGSHRRLPVDVRLLNLRVPINATWLWVQARCTAEGIEGDGRIVWVPWQVARPARNRHGSPPTR